MSFGSVSVIDNSTLSVSGGAVVDAETLSVSGNVKITDGSKLNISGTAFGEMNLELSPGMDNQDHRHSRWYVQAL
ncbi:MAG: hypothetical protein LUG14_10140 [Synergistaceae bacterium]|nr:hypothetical protein [Synergistaceae bacterium]